MNHERHLPGEVRQDGGASVFQLAKAHQAEAIKTLVQLMREGMEKTRVMAALALLDYAKRAEPDYVPPQVIDAPLRLAEPAADVSGVSKERMRLAKVAVIEAINQSPETTWTVPTIAGKTKLTSNIVAAIVTQLFRDQQIERPSPGMYKAKRH